jgi:phage/plasmid-like protein (TIGR03299 family)
MRNPFYFGVDLKAVEGGAAEKLAAAGLNFNVEMSPALYRPDLTSESNVQTVENQFHIVRTDTKQVISEKTVSNKFRLVQNTDAFSFIDASAVISEIAITHGGVFQRGANVFMVGKYPTASLLDDGSSIEHYILLSNGHTGKQNLTARPLNVYTKTGAIVSTTEDKSYAIRHTTNMAKRMNDVLGAIKKFKEASTEFVSNAKNLHALPCSVTQAEEYFKSCMDVDNTEDSPSRQKNAIDKFSSLFTASGGANWWNAYQSLCEYITFDRSSKSSKTTGSDSAANRAYGVLFGASSRLMDDALVHALRNVK